MKQITLDYYADPGHGWVKFPLKRLEKLGICGAISSCSYKRGGSAFLEEDGDAAILVRELRAQGYEVKFRQSHSNRRSKIRGYQQFV